MSSAIIRPPLPPPLSHEGIRFVLDRNVAGCSSDRALPEEIIAIIAASLHELLPPGDLVVNERGQVAPSKPNNITQRPVSLWHQAGLLAGIDRSPL